MLQRLINISVWDKMFPKQPGVHIPNSYEFIQMTYPWPHP